ncbi:hypothetical protein LCGC14_1648070 [marine sediment metagenome]|uniref:Bacteriophage Mu GpT domain-containing protein n=1 Tax=marine sediment metagenome TaxID=412755 RepID=A0A0F9HXK6_9ZZZZ
MNKWVILREATIDYLMRSTVPGVHLNPAVGAAATQLATLYESEKGAGDGWDNPAFPWKAVMMEAMLNPGKLHEAQGAAAFGQLLRAGVQLMANGWYKRYPTMYAQVAQITSSNKRQEFYAPLFGADIPEEVEAGNPFPESQIVGQDREIINKKFGRIESFNRELFDDDQTGQVSTRAQRLGESMGLWEDMYFSRRFIGVADTTWRTPIAASNWSGVNANGTTISNVFDVLMYSTAIGGNRPAAYVQLGFGVLLLAIQQLRRAVDPLDVSMVVTPNKIMVSSFDEFNVDTLLNSKEHPSVPFDPSTAANVGLMRGVYSKNPLMGKFTSCMNLHLKAGVWSVGQSNTGYVHQQRDPMEIVQEQPQSGKSFELEAMRFRSRARWEQEWIDPRFWYLGNDGSASLTQ